MRKPLFAILLAGAFLLGTNLPKTEAPDLYPQVTRIEAIEDYGNGTYGITSVDFNGNLWSFDTTAEDYHEGDLVSLIMDTVGTETIYDDVIVASKYDGFLDSNLFTYEEIEEGR